MSGQGGIAVLVSAAQLVLALVASFGPSAPVEGLPDPSDGAADGPSGSLAGVGLWALAAAGTSGCFYALRELRGHNEFANVMMPHSTRAEDNSAGKDKGLTRTVLRKNKLLEFSAAWVFAVTLVSLGLSICRSVRADSSIGCLPGNHHHDCLGSIPHTPHPAAEHLYPSPLPRCQRCVPSAPSRWRYAADHLQLATTSAELICLRVPPCSSRLNPGFCSCPLPEHCSFRSSWRATLAAWPLTDTLR